MPWQDVRYYSEESEVDLRDPIKDYELYRETCQELQRLMAEIQELKSRGIKENVRKGLHVWCNMSVIWCFPINPRRKTAGVMMCPGQSQGNGAASFSQASEAGTEPLEMEQLPLSQAHEAGIETLELEQLSLSLAPGTVI